MGQFSPAAMVAPLLLILAGIWSFLPSNATLAWAWPWFAIWFIGLTILVTLSAVALGAPDSHAASSRSERTLRAGLVLFLAVPLLGALRAPDSLRAIASAGGLCLGIAATLVTLSRPEIRPWLRPGGKLAGVLTVFGMVWGAASLAVYQLTQRGPLLDRMSALDERLGGGKGLLLDQMPDLALLRNTDFFGHANLVAGFALLLLPFPVSRILAGERKVLPLSSLMVLLVVLFTAESRLSFLALGVGVVAGIILLWGRGGARRSFFLAGLAAVVMALAALILSPRVRSLLEMEDFFTGNPDVMNRASQIEAAWRCGVENFPTGAGEGTANANYERMRPTLGGSIDGILHYHTTPAHLWAVYGVCGLAALGLLGWQVWRTRAKGPAVAHKAGLAMWLVASLGDYNLDQAAPVMLLGIHLASLCAAQPGEEGAPSRRPWGTAALLGLWVPLLGFFLVRNLPARLAVEDYFQQSLKSPGAAALVERHHSLTPHDPYLYNLHASRLMELDPHDTAAVLALRASLEINPDQEFAHTWLAWALLENDPAEAARHFRASLGLQPRVQGLCDGMARAHLASGKRPAAIRAWAAQCLQFPYFMLGSHWQKPPMRDVEREVLEETVASAERLLAKPGLARFLTPRLGFVRDLAKARLQGRSQGEMRGYLSSRNRPSEEFFKAWDHPEQRLEVITRALAAGLHPNPFEDAEVASIEALARRLTMLMAASGDDPLAFFLKPAENYRPSLRRINFGILHGHSRSLSPELPWETRIGVPEAALFGDFNLGLVGSDFAWVLDAPLPPPRQ